MLFDIPSPSTGGAVGIVAAVSFLLIFLAAAFIAFRVLRKSVKMAFRLAIVAVILMIAVAGSVSFWWLGSSKPARTERPRPTQPK
jgi:flagellar basal body-associated protein FliL